MTAAERDLGLVRRRVLVADPGAQVLHLATPRSRAFIRNGRIRVEKRHEEIGSVPAERVMSLIVHGNADVSSALIRELLWRGTPILWCSGTGRLVAWAVPAASPNDSPRVSQHVASASGHLGLARKFVEALVSPVPAPRKVPLGGPGARPDAPRRKVPSMTSLPTPSPAPATRAP